jgi:hypothetical protein
MNKFQKGDMLVVLQSSDKNNVGKVGAVIDITDGDYYTLDVMPNYAFKEDCLKKAHGADLIREERRRQIEVEGYDAKHDFNEPLNNIVAAAVSYAMVDIDKQEAEAWWNWDFKYWKPKDRKRNLVRAGALIAAALDKMQDEEDFKNWQKENKV